MDLSTIQQAISELEYEDPTVDTVRELACLYIVRDNLSKPSNTIEKELTEILPQYRVYCETKRKYQLHELTEEAVIDSMKKVCSELKEFITTLYSSTDFYKERKIFLQSIEDLHKNLIEQEDTP